jgi:hypothetical protein
MANKRKTKNLFLIVVFAVTWKSFVAVERGGGVWITDTSEANRGTCRLDIGSYQDEFDDEKSAVARANDLQAEKKNFDIRVWEVEKKPIAGTTR